jgi:outer membrane receptor protein involved in Fe transport
VTRRIRVGYGAKYATHDYLVDGDLLSPRASITLQPLERDSLRVRASVSHRETAAGVEEFVPPTVGLWLPPERTFSQISREAFRPERLDYVEIAAERQWAGAVVIGVRAFTERVEDQLITVFGTGSAATPESVGHYQVGSAGDFEARGWGVSVSRDLGTGVRAAIDYTAVESERRRSSPDAEALMPVAAMIAIAERRFHDLTASVESTVPQTATRVYVLYKINGGFAPETSLLASARFNVQVNQALPFMDFTNAQWEMLAAVSNVFHEEAADSSVYDEMFVVRPPKRVLGGVTVRF